MSQPPSHRLSDRWRPLALGAAAIALIGGVVLVALPKAGGGSQDAYAKCSREVRPVISAMQDLGSHLDVGIVEQDYTSRVGDVNATYDRLRNGHPDPACREIISALGEAMDQYTQGSSYWNDCLGDCLPSDVNYLNDKWLKAGVDLAQANRLLRDIRNGQ